MWAQANVWQDPSNLLAVLDMPQPPLCSHTPTARQAPQPLNPCHRHTRASQLSTLPTALAVAADLSWPVDNVQPIQGCTP